MKQVRMTILILCVAAGVSLSAATINCTKPVQGQILYAGQSYEIFWHRSGDMQDRVRIVLKGEALARSEVRAFSLAASRGLVIVEETPNDNLLGNRYLWQVPDQIPSGEYRLHIMTLDEQVMGRSPMFTIRRREEQEGRPDLVFTGEFKLGERIHRVGRGGTVVITPGDLNDWYRKQIQYDPNTGKAVSMILPVKPFLKNIGEAHAGATETIIRKIGSHGTVPQADLAPGEETRRDGSYSQMGMDLSAARAFELLWIIDPDERIPDRDRGNNRFFFILEFQNFK